MPEADTPPASVARNTTLLPRVAGSKKSAKVAGPSGRTAVTVAARRHERPALDVVDALGPGPRRVQDLAGERGVGCRHLDALVVGEGPGAVAPREVGPERRVDGAGEPVEHDVGQQLVLREAAL